MGFLDKMIKQAVDNAVANTVERKVTDIVAPKINNAVNQVADTVVPTTPAVQNQPVQQENIQVAGAQLGGMFGGLASMAQGFANEAAKNMKICHACQEPAGADVTFCPKCGAELPAQTVAQGAVCTGCGKQNDIGTKFCAGCGTKLPFAIEEENAAKQRDEVVLAKWDALLPQYPRWCFGGRELSLEVTHTDENGNNYYSFYAGGVGSVELEQYKQLLKQNGFRTAGGNIPRNPNSLSG